MNSFMMSRSDIVAFCSARCTSDPNPAHSIYRIVIGFLLGSLLWKSKFYHVLYHFYVENQIKDEFFPALLCDVNVLAAMVVVPVILGAIVLVTTTTLMFRIQAIVTAACMFGLCIHQCSYNDVTFLTAFWVSIWCVWYSLHIDEPYQELLKKSQTFAVLILSLIFLGGAAGKWTDGYWSGEVIYSIYFVEYDYWFFNYLKAYLSQDSLREFATYYSRMIVLMESSCIFLWLLPSRIASAIAFVTLTGIIVFSNPQLFSVMCCLFGLCLVGLHRVRPQTAAA